MSLRQLQSAVVPDSLRLSYFFFVVLCFNFCCTSADVLLDVDTFVVDAAVVAAKLTLMWMLMAGLVWFRLVLVWFRLVLVGRDQRNREIQSQTTYDFIQ